MIRKKKERQANSRLLKKEVFFLFQGVSLELQEKNPRKSGPSLLNSCPYAQNAKDGASMAKTFVETDEPRPRSACLARGGSGWKSMIIIDIVRYSISQVFNGMEAGAGLIRARTGNAKPTIQFD
ncbi:hypothetical protein [Salicibibacter kimchii]|uniref:Uncharacterized protein n=1 Tax=Salicibibacter kimchii TaxID=2099786 RepID=A0A345BV17_9BACI|nr:hypothetical protein [Salicibibacter kimchii]AXF54798.1 hypothetical protein DT065_01370 [Salicibibacter kimchii]